MRAPKPWVLASCVNEATPMTKLLAIDHETVLFDRPVRSFIGSVKLDLTDVRMLPGCHRIALQVGLGSIEVHVPQHVTVTFGGGVLLGSVEVRDALDGIDRDVPA